jgi:cAMP phosphodiesterase
MTKVKLAVALVAVILMTIVVIQNTGSVEMDNFKMDCDFEQAQDGNIALTGEIDLSQGLEFIVAVAFGRSAQSASTQLLQALVTPFAQQREKYVSQWQCTRGKATIPQSPSVD